VKKRRKREKRRMKCNYIDKNGYCRHRKNQERGRTNMKCIKNGCYYNTSKTSKTKKIKNEN